MPDNDNNDERQWPREIDACGDRPPIDVVNELWRALREKYPNRFFRRGSTLLLRKNNQLEEVSADRLAAYLNSAAAFVDGKGRYKHPHRDFVRAMASRPEVACPEIVGIVEAPYLAPDRTLVSERGYNPVTELWLEPAADLGEFEPMKLPQAMENIDRMLAFPFATQADRAHTLGLFLLPFVRPAILGPTPMHLITATKEGAGKTYLARCAHLLATGAEPSIRSLDSWQSEASRQLTSALAEIPAFLLWDNLPTGLRLGWADLHRFVSSHGRIPIRLVGAGREIVVPIRCVWVATANNADVDAEQARRTVLIRLVDGSTRRSGAEAPEVFIRRNRTLAVASVLRLVKQWIRMDCPKPARTLAGFGEWSDIVGGIVSVALGEEHWLSVQHRPRPGVIDDWIYLFKVWPLEAGTSSHSGMKPADVAHLVEELALPVLGEAIDAGVKGRVNSTKMGKLLTDLVTSGRALGDFVMRRKRTRNGWVYWPEPVAEAPRT
ncbi:MAG: hypothetical protein Q8P18_21300 [Pseudomonadota bacterium]|nr:hypothetical protein [Pseudomonadota bacterium]